MRRLAVIGTSHVAAIKQGWDLVAPDHPDWRVEFLAATTTHFRKLRLDKSLQFGLPKSVAALDPEARRAVKRINGRSSIDLTEADVVLWAGFKRPLAALCDLLATHDVDDLREADAPSRLSRASFEAICGEIAARAVPGPRWIGWDAPQLFVLSRPTPPETVLDVDDPRFESWSRVARSPDGLRGAMDAFNALYETQLARHRVALLRQPEESLAPSGLTAARWSAGSRRLRGGALHPDDDYEHLNADYGALLLAALFERVAPTPAAAPAPVLSAIQA